MDPLIVFDVDGQMLLAAGHHRLAAHKRLGKRQVLCVIKQGTRLEALEYGIRDNLQHRGERLTSADKRHTVRLMLTLKSTRSDSAIAKMCGVTDKTVAKYRKDLELTSDLPKSTKRLGEDGREVETKNIGQPVADPQLGAGRLVTDSESAKSADRKSNSAELDRLWKNAQIHFGKLQRAIDMLKSAGGNAIRFRQFDSPIEKFRELFSKSNHDDRPF